MLNLKRTFTSDFVTTWLHLPGPIDMVGDIIDDMAVDTTGDTVVVVGDIVANIVWDTVTNTAEDTVDNIAEDILHELVLAEVTVWSIKGDMWSQ